MFSLKTFFEVLRMHSTECKSKVNQRAQTVLNKSKSEGMEILGVRRVLMKSITKSEHEIVTLCSQIKL